MMNLLIALMGGSYERVEENTQNAMRRQRAELLLSLEVLMSPKAKADAGKFPRWVYWYRPSDSSGADDEIANGVIHGVGRLLKRQSAVQESFVQKVLENKVGELGAKIQEQDTKIQLVTDVLSAQQQAIASMDAKLEMVLQAITTPSQENVA
eukprot:COSAG02_NODE_2175_length_9589_cov_6.644573_5_plen_152_part_00